MKNFRNVIATAIFGLIICVPFFAVTSVLANVQQGNKSDIKALRSSKVKLEVKVEKKLVGTTSEGKNQVVWLSLGNKVKVCPGDTLRYRITSTNKVDLSAQNLVITQAIPPNMLYVAESAQGNNATITYSIDKGKTFVSQPTLKKTLSDGKVVEVAAPVERYTNIKWTYEHNIDRQEDILVTYDLQVRSR